MHVDVERQNTERRNTAISILAIVHTTDNYGLWVTLYLKMENKPCYNADLGKPISKITAEQSNLNRYNLTSYNIPIS